MMFSRSFAVHGGVVPRGRIEALYRLQAAVQSWALEHVVFASSPSGDLRWIAAAAGVRALAALETVVERQLVLLARHIMRRALRGARFAGAAGTADTMLAAGGH